MLSSKDGFIKIGNHTGINSSTIIQSTNQCSVIIDNDVIIGQQCFIIGGGNYNTERLDVPIRVQGIKKDAGVTIDQDVWIGAKVTILGGVSIGKSSIIAAGSVLTKSIPKMSLCRGIPAEVYKMRHE